jgi:hypothetical protein
MRALPFAIAIAVLAISAHAATESSLPETSASAAAPAAVSASAPVGFSDGAVGIPALEIEWSCGECKPNEKIPPLIQSAYAGAAGAGKITIVDGDPVHVKISQFHQRNPALRSLFGFMAGKDEMTVTVSWHGKQATAHDYEANAWHGMNAIAESVGKKTFAAVRTFVADERAGALTPAR